MSVLGSGWGEFDEIGVFLTSQGHVKETEQPCLETHALYADDSEWFLFEKPVACEKYFTFSLLILLKSCKSHLCKSNKSNLAAPVTGHSKQEISAREKNISH